MRLPIHRHVLKVAPETESKERSTGIGIARYVTDIPRYGVFIRPGGLKNHESYSHRVASATILTPEELEKDQIRQQCEAAIYRRLRLFHATTLIESSRIFGFHSVPLFRLTY